MKGGTKTGRYLDLAPECAHKLAPAAAYRALFFSPLKVTVLGKIDAASQGPLHGAYLQIKSQL